MSGKREPSLEMKVKIKSAFGREIITPADPTAERFAKLARQKTLTRRDIDLIKELGFRVLVVHDIEEL